MQNEWGTINRINIVHTNDHCFQNQKSARKTVHFFFPLSTEMPGKCKKDNSSSNNSDEYISKLWIYIEANDNIQIE